MDERIQKETKDVHRQTIATASSVYTPPIQTRANLSIPNYQRVKSRGFRIPGNDVRRRNIDVMKRETSLVRWRGGRKRRKVDVDLHEYPAEYVDELDRDD